MKSSVQEVTHLLHEWQRYGDEEALSHALQKVYGDLRRLAQHLMAGEHNHHTLQATALVHEAFLQLPDGSWPIWWGRRHFLNSMARLMRRLLVDHARSRACAKRNPGTPLASLNEALEIRDDHVPDEAGVLQLLALDEALDRLAQVDPRKARILELRAFAGLSLKETAEVLGLSTATIIVEARLAKAWLSRHLQD